METSLETRQTDNDRAQEGVTMPSGMTKLDHPPSTVLLFAVVVLLSVSVPVYFFPKADCEETKNQLRETGTQPVHKVWTLAGTMCHEIGHEVK